MYTILKDKKGQALAIFVVAIIAGIIILGIICLVYPPFYAWLKDLIETIGRALRGQ